MKLLSKGNSKLADHVGTFSIIASKEVCGRECPGCYAIAEQKRWKGTVVKGRNNRLDISKSDLFVDQMITEIKKSKFKYIRLHGSGEFYSQEYINKWVEIAKEIYKFNPNIIFYTYTKRKNDYDFSIIENLDNFIIHNSIVEDDNRSYINYGTLEYLNKIKRDTFICPVTTMDEKLDKQCGNSCTWCMEPCNKGTSIVFKVH